MTRNTTQIKDSASSLVFFDDWLQELGKTRCTGWRWRERGIIKTVNIFGRHYIHRDEIARFESRAMSGELAQEAKTPSRASKAAK